MKRILLIVFAIFLLTNQSWAKHEKGGYIQYQYMGRASDTTKSIYKVTITVFYSCVTTGPRVLALTIYDAKTLGNAVSTTDFTSENSETSITKTTYSPCLNNPPTICYLVDTYSTTVTLPNDSNGYIMGAITTVGNTNGHRVGGIVNIFDAGCSCGNNNNIQTCYSSCGTELAMWAQIPGTINGVDYHTNSSPTFLFKDTAVICHGENFQYQFTAVDNVDNDSLSYSFGPGQDGSIVTKPPYPSVTYAAGYSSSSPMGSGVTINPATGLISGIAPTTTGEYILDVFVKEWRNGVLLDSVKKELQIDVNDCSLLAANLQQVYVNCDSLTLSFQNESTASNITTYLWNFGDSTSSNDSGTTPIATHTYTHAGDYTLSLYVADTVNGCNNSTTAQVKVYPGFVPKFGVKGSCYQAPFYFTDSTATNPIDSVNSWSWNFGDPTLLNNTAYTDTASHQYSQPDTVQATLQVATYRGCSGADTMQVIINDKPYIFLPFTDTLICSIDTLPLIAQTSAPNFKWSLGTNVIDSTTKILVVNNLNDTSIYTFTAYQNGCVGSVNDTVNVLHFITVGFNPDTMHVCLTDSTTLSPISYALSYHWTESDGLNTLSNDSIKNPKASPINTVTTYHVYANLGHCPSDSVITLYASPYPKLDIVGPFPDTTICFGGSAPLRVAKKGVYASWSTTNGLSDSSSTSPIASPLYTTLYTITVKDTFYCSKPVSESVLVYVVPQFYVTAGNDTAVILGEPLKMHATLTDTAFAYPVSYQWVPATYLDYPDSADPTITGILTTPDTMLYRIIGTTPQGCTDTGHVKVTFFRTQPDIFVPSGFTHNGTVAKNNVLIPVPVGISHFEYFRVFDRYGHLVFGTSQVGKGWDGTYNGTTANEGTYVYDTKGIDYLGVTIHRSGTVVLIR